MSQNPVDSLFSIQWTVPFPDIFNKDYNRKIEAVARRRDVAFPISLFLEFSSSSTADVVVSFRSEGMRHFFKSHMITGQIAILPVNVYEANPLAPLCNRRGFRVVPGETEDSLRIKAVLYHGMEMSLFSPVSRGDYQDIIINVLILIEEEVFTPTYHSNYLASSDANLSAGNFEDIFNQIHIKSVDKDKDPPLGQTDAVFAFTWENKKHLCFCHRRVLETCCRYPQTEAAMVDEVRPDVVLAVFSFMYCGKFTDVFQWCDIVQVFKVAVSLGYTRLIETACTMYDEFGNVGDWKLMLFFEVGAPAIAFDRFLANYLLMSPNKIENVCATIPLHKCPWSMYVIFSHFVQQGTIWEPLISSAELMSQFTLFCVCSSRAQLQLETSIFADIAAHTDIEDSD